MAIQYQAYLKIPGGAWTLIDNTYETELAIPSAVQDLLDYFSIYEWRIDTYDDVVKLTTTGDTWTFISQRLPFFTTSTSRLGSIRRSDYDPDKVWQPGVGWVDIDDFEYTGGGRYKGRVVVVGHKTIYFGDI